MQNTSGFNYDVDWNTEWNDMKKYGPTSRHTRRFTKQLMRPLNFKSVLDVGCGQGSLLAELLTEFPEIEPTGVDISDSAVELARLKVPNGQFSVLDIVKDRLNKSFDLVICIDVLEHIPDDLSALSNIAYMTDKYLLVSSIQGRMRHFEAEAVGHIRNYGQGELVQKIEKTGLKILDIVEWGFPFYSPLYRNFLELTGARGTTGEFSLIRRMISSILYYILFLNSSKRGDEIFVLAERPRNNL